MDPIAPKYREQMNDLARALDRALNPNPARKTLGFALFIFEFNAPGRANYISNANRADMITAMKETHARFEGQADVKGTA